MKHNPCTCSVRYFICDGCFTYLIEPGFLWVHSFDYIVWSLEIAPVAHETVSSFLRVEQRFTHSFSLEAFCRGAVCRAGTLPSAERLQMRRGSLSRWAGRTGVRLVSELSLGDCQLPEATIMLGDNPPVVSVLYNNWQLLTRLWWLLWVCWVGWASPSVGRLADLAWPQTGQPRPLGAAFRASYTSGQVLTEAA